MRKLILGAMVASAIVATGAAKPVRADTDVYLNFGPPAVRYEAAPAPRAGYVWAPGYWDYRSGQRHVWVQGRWVRERPGYVYYAPAWRHDGGRWHLERERWDRGDRYARRGGDRDRDGVPNAYDRDRDGDGVPNRYDNNPNNPRYR
jgi:hypothetical protein